jgi:hypothetical protein
MIDIGKFKNNSIFNIILDAFSFDFNNNILTLNGGSLKNVPNRQYEILVTTFYRSIQYTQKVHIKLENVVELPLVLIE